MKNCGGFGGASRLNPEEDELCEVEAWADSRGDESVRVSIPCADTSAVKPAFWVTNSCQLLCTTENHASVHSAIECVSPEPRLASKMPSCRNNLHMASQVSPTELPSFSTERSPNSKTNFSPTAGRDQSNNRVVEKRGQSALNSAISGRVPTRQTIFSEPSHYPARREVARTAGISNFVRLIQHHHVCQLRQ